MVKSVDNTKETKKTQIDRKKLINEEHLEKMLATVTKRHNMLKQKLKKTKNPKSRDKSTLQYMLKQSIEMLELANATFITSGGRGIYSLVALNNNIRELQSDLRALEDNSNQIEFLVNSVIKPMLTIISQQNLNLIMVIKKEISRKMRSAEASVLLDKINDLLKTQANLFDDCLEQASTQIQNYYDE